MNTLTRMVAMTGLLFCFSGLALAEGNEHVSAKLHPNLAAAQKMSENAINKIDAAQAANEFDMGGHAAKAKELLNQAIDEIKQAALGANKANSEKKN